VLLISAIGNPAVKNGTAGTAFHLHLRLVIDESIFNGSAIIFR
jgi:hypothetical protein